MSKMLKRKKRRKLSKLLKKFIPPKIRGVVSPPTKIFKSIKNYNRSKNKEIVKKEMDD